MCQALGYISNITEGEKSLEMSVEQIDHDNFIMMAKSDPSRRGV